MRHKRTVHLGIGKRRFITNFSTLNYIWVVFIYLNELLSTAKIVNKQKPANKNIKKCNDCGIYVQRTHFSGHLRSREHILKCITKTKNNKIRYIKVNSAFKNRISQHRLIGDKYNVDIKSYLESMSDNIKELLLISYGKGET